jgi:hypothetical protein
MDTDGEKLKKDYMYEFVYFDKDGIFNRVIGKFRGIADNGDYFFTNTLRRNPTAAWLDYLLLPKQVYAIFQKIDSMQFNKLSMGGKKSKARRNRKRKNTRRTRRR